jgi:hypothetical protein
MAREAYGIANEYICLVSDGWVSLKTNIWITFRLLHIVKNSVFAYLLLIVVMQAKMVKTKPSRVPLDKVWLNT